MKPNSNIKKKKTQLEKEIIRLLFVVSYRTFMISTYRLNKVTRPKKSVCWAGHLCFASYTMQVRQGNDALLKAESLDALLGNF